MKETTKERWLGRLSLAAYLIALISFVFAAISAPRLLELLGHRDPDEYKLVIIQALLGAVAVNLPPVAERLFKIRIPRWLSLIFTLFLWGSVFLGEALGFYYRFRHWDDVLHLCSGAILVSVGFLLSDWLGGHTKTAISPIFGAIFAFCFSLSLGTVWEIYEYLLDGALGINMQKFSDGSAISDRLVPLVGREALRDTMEDLCVDFIGGALASVTGFFKVRDRNSRPQQDRDGSP